MTREEAKDLLDNLIGMVDDNHASDYDTALKMAIKALEKEPLTKYTISGFYFAGGVRKRFCEEVYAESSGKAVDLVLGKYAWRESLAGNSFKLDLGTLAG